MERSATFSLKTRCVGATSKRLLGVPGPFRAFTENEVCGGGLTPPTLHQYYREAVRSGLVNEDKRGAGDSAIGSAGSGRGGSRTASNDRSTQTCSAVVSSAPAASGASGSMWCTRWRSEIPRSSLEGMP